MEGRLREPFRLSGGEWLVSFTTRGDAGKIYDRLKDADVDVEIKKHNPKRSKTSNAFLWALCSDIGNAMTPPLPKEEVYRKAIRDVGEYEPLPIKAEAVETFRQRWKDKGIGWFAEVVDDSKLPGYKLVFAYYGSSTYDTVRMHKLIDYVLDEAEQLDLKIPVGKEKEDLFHEWGFC